MVRAKFFVESKTEVKGNGFAVEMKPVIGGSEENEKFYKYTPGGTLSMQFINGEVAEKLEVGKEYYVDVTPAE